MDQKKFRKLIVEGAKMLGIISYRFNPRVSGLYLFFIGALRS